MPQRDILERTEGSGRGAYTHEILTSGADFDRCRERVLAFFESYELVRYGAVRVDESRSLCAAREGFEERLEQALAGNRAVLDGLVKELEDEGIASLDRLRHLPQGYLSKTLHVITHFLDGFFGIDTCFFNLEEDSHWVSGGLRERIRANPSRYWIVVVEGSG